MLVRYVGLFLQGFFLGLLVAVAGKIFVFVSDPDKAQNHRSVCHLSKSFLFVYSRFLAAFGKPP